VYPLFPEFQVLVAARCSGVALLSFVLAASKVACARFVLYVCALYWGFGGEVTFGEDLVQVFGLHFLATATCHVVYIYRGAAFDEAGFVLGCFLASLAYSCAKELVKHLTPAFVLRAAKDATLFSLVSLAYWIIMLRIFPVWVEKRRRASLLSVFFARLLGQ
jgi:hypothetical protein